MACGRCGLSLSTDEMIKRIRCDKCGNFLCQKCSGLNQTEVRVMQLVTGRTLKFICCPDVSVSRELDPGHPDAVAPDAASAAVISALQTKMEEMESRVQSALGRLTEDFTTLRESNIQLIHMLAPTAPPSVNSLRAASFPCSSAVEEVGERRTITQTKSCEKELPAMGVTEDPPLATLQTLTSDRREPLIPEQRHTGKRGFNRKRAEKTKTSKTKKSDTKNNESWSISDDAVQLKQSEADHQGFIRVSSRRNKSDRGSRGVTLVGKLTDPAGIRAVDPRIRLFISRLHPETSVEDFTNYLQERQVSPCDCERLPISSSGVAAFKLTINAQDRNTVMSADFWPVNTIIRPFQQNRLQNFQKRGPSKLRE